MRIAPTHKNATLGIFRTHLDAQNAVKGLQGAGFRIDQLSIVGKARPTEENLEPAHRADARMKRWGKQGAFWGGICGIFLGSAFASIPEIGPLLVAGPLAGSMVDVLEGAVGETGLSVFGAAFISVGIPEDRIFRYESAIRADHFVLIAHGSSQEMERARGVLKLRNAVSEVETV